MAIVIINDVPTEVGTGAEEILSLRAENQRLRAALVEAKEDILAFGNHDWDCQVYKAKPCTCWQRKAIDAIEKAIKEETQ